MYALKFKRPLDTDRDVFVGLVICSMALLSFTVNYIFMRTIFMLLLPICGCWRRVKVDVSKNRYVFIFRTKVNRVNLQTDIEYFSELSAIQPTFTRFQEPEMDSASTVNRHETFALQGCYAVLLDIWLPTFRDGLLVPSSRVKLSKTLDDDTDKPSRNICNQPPANVA
jgi:hypothetical protein